ncbi:hypothetical protein [Streptomyces lydicus]|uniref:hypothetical protein n=1 Tax=Streptomyces lydicus TaxID=47763 RepID=UPI001013667D|nr:hypothetical protein [Streptomyces lydicus]
MIAAVPTFAASLLMVRDTDAVGLVNARIGGSTVRGRPPRAHPEGPAATGARPTRTGCPGVHGPAAP